MFSKTQLFKVSPYVKHLYSLIKRCQIQNREMNAWNCRLNLVETVGLWVKDGDGVAVVKCRNGRLREGDRLLAVDGHVLSEKSSLEDAAHCLQSASGRVTLRVAHKADSTHSLGYNSQSAQTYSQPPTDEPPVSRSYQLLSFSKQLLLDLV